MSTHLDTLRQMARELPEAPGVYFWRDGKERVLYIGKAVNLRARVTSYFSNARRDRRIREMVSRARSLSCEVTETELQALFRESALIKQHLPPYNRLLRTSVLPWYLKFDRALTDPYMEIARGKEDDGSLYFGPFRSAAVMRETMSYLHDALPLRKCTAIKPRCRPCLYFQMHKCAAPLIDAEHRRNHEEAIQSLFELLDGRTDRVIAWLEAKRDRLSESLLFERAAEVQARLEALHDLLQKQTILEAAVQCRCVLIFQNDAVRGERRLLLVAQGEVISMLDAQLATVPLVMRWIRAHEPVIDRVRLRQSEVDAADVLQRWLRIHREHVRWVAIPANPGEEDLRDRVGYVLGDGAEATSARPVAAAARGGERG